MSKKLLFGGWSLVLVFALLTAGCNKDEEELPGEFAELMFSEQDVMDKLPDGLLASGDPKAQECVDMIESALDMSEFQANLIVPDHAQRSSKKASGETWSWTFTHMGGTWTFSWTYREDASKHYWDMEIQFGDGPRYDYITAWEMKDGTSGQLVYSFNWVLIYEGTSEYEDLHWIYIWQLDQQGSYHFSWSCDTDVSEFEYLMNYDIVIHADGSGELDYFYFDALFYHMEWDSAGNGFWVYYFEGLEQSGSWIAG